ncbi:Uma2 family endonuclease [Streptomyces sp. NPDC001941]|uniref:Uma2 family endonuclease n=1 Tax=Streptomyces sp. NPDC001941 TaxID=3154659 RepID=UPI00332BCD9C
MSAAAEDQQDAPEEPYVFPVPPVGGWTADDLDRIPGLPQHTELIDGGLFFVSPQTIFHMAALRLLDTALVQHVPDTHYVAREISVKLGPRDRPEPDLMVVAKSALSGLAQTWFSPEDVLLAVEIVSPESVHRDRELKPRRYAAAGIRHHWRVELDDEEQAVLYAYELDPGSGTYALTGIHRKAFTLDQPFPTEIDLSRLV